LASIAYGQWAQNGAKLIAVPALAYQGYSLSLTDTGSYLALGGPYLNNGRGAAWIFVHNTTDQTWNVINFQLIGSDPQGLLSYEGYSVDFSSDGSTLVSGGPYDNLQTGAVWVFVRDPSKDNTWIQQGSKLVGSGAGGQTPFQGCSVSVSSDGNTLASGGNGDASGNGAVWIFTRTNNVWSQQGSKLAVAAASPDGNFGTSVALSGDGNTLAVGAPGDGGEVGAVWIFTRSGSTWTQQGGKLVGSEAVAPTQQGSSLAISSDGTTVLVGGPSDANFNGAVWIFVRSGSTWSQQGPKIVGTGVATSQFGSSVSLSGDGNVAAVGGRDDSKFMGATWIYSRQSSTWSQDGDKLVGTGNTGVAEQGIGVALSKDGKLVTTGGYHDNDFVGAAWVFYKK